MRIGTWNIDVLTQHYARVFSLQEVERSPTLQWMLGALTLGVFVFFDHWSALIVGTKESVEQARAVCWPFFQNCTDLYFLNGGSTDYSQGIFYMALYGVIALIVWCMWKRYWVAAHALFLILFLWEILFVFVYNYNINAPYYYYHIFFAALWLFVPYKEYFLKVGLVLLYFLSATIKFDDGWVLGTYFTSLKNGLPIFPDALTPLITNIVIFSQVIGCWFLFSKKRLLQRGALIFFAAFHLYSAIFVHFMYPTIVLPSLLILFGPLYRYTSLPVSRKALTGWGVLGLMIVFQLLGFTIPTDRRLSLEGNRFGMFMFEANHQCIINAATYSLPHTSSADEAHYDVPAGSPCRTLYCQTKLDTYTENDTVITERRWESGSARYRCDPYDWWTQLQSECLKLKVLRISLTMDHSVNGGPFYRIVNTPNVCELSYKPFVHNDWIMLPPEAEAIGRPVKNVYW